MSEPRVLYIDQTSQLGGAELSLLELVRRQPGPGTVVLFEEGPFARLLKEHDVPVVICPLGDRAARVKKCANALTLLTAARAMGPVRHRVRGLAADHDVVYANTSKAMVVAALVRFGTRRPLVYHLRDMISAEHFSRTNRRVLVTAANRYATKVIANSQATADAFVAAGGQHRKVIVIPNGFDPAPFEQAWRRRRELRERLRAELKLRDATPTVALVGRIAKWKGQHVAVKALEQLPGVHLLLVGDALFGEEAYEQQLVDLARVRGVSHRLRWLGFRHDIPAVLQAADVVVHASTVAEPFGRVIVEAMLSRRPVVATRGGGTTEIVRHEETGLLSEMGSADKLAEAVRRLLSDPAKACGMATRAYAVAKERYDIERLAPQVTAVIEEVATR